jgi:hypothetical protein
VEKALPIERGSLASRRRFLGTAGSATLALAPLRALADSMVTLPLPGGPDERQITTAFRKAPLFSAPARRSSTPDVFDQSVFTPNDRSSCAGTGPSSRRNDQIPAGGHGHVNQS